MKPLPICLVLSALLWAASPAAPATTAAPLTVAPALLADGAMAGGERLVSIESLRRFYSGRGQRLAWSDAGGPSPQIGAFLKALRAAAFEGLEPDDYHTAALERLIGSRWPASGPAPAAASPEAPALAAADLRALDLLLSDAFFLYAAHLTSGRVAPQSVEPEWNIGGRARDLVLLLGSALERGHLATTLGELPPAGEGYRRLRDALASRRAIAAAGEPPFVSDGPSLREGERDPRVATLRRRLSTAGDLPAGGATAGDLFDPALTRALQRFQQRHGLEPDGIAGPRTLAALNRPADRRVGQIVANLERLRWLPSDLGPRRLVVNIADFRLELVEPGKPALTMRVIAGLQDRRTPLLGDSITGVLLNPTWTVPQRIVLEDKFPLILDDRDFFANQGFRVLTRESGTWREIDQADVDWTTLIDKPFHYRLRQDPGPKNALGRVKFEMPNRHQIYLHDTPTLGLFASAERTFSSGCIRVEHAVDLAERLLESKKGWTRPRLEKTIASGVTVRVPLAEPLSVFLLYATAWVDDEGRLQLREDVYGRDAALLEALARERKRRSAPIIKPHRISGKPGRTRAPGRR